MFCVLDHRRIGVNILAVQQNSSAFQLQTWYQYFHSVFFHTEQHIAFIFRYTCNCASQVQRYSLMWLPVTLSDYDGSMFSAISLHHFSVKFDFTWKELCHPLPIICYCPFSLSSTCRCSVCWRLIIWFWKASVLVSTLGYLHFYLDLGIAVLNCYFGLY